MITRRENVDPGVDRVMLDASVAIQKGNTSAPEPSGLRRHVMLRVQIRGVSVTVIRRHTNWNVTYAKSQDNDSSHYATYRLRAHSVAQRGLTLVLLTASLRLAAAPIPHAAILSRAQYQAVLARTRR